MTIPDTNIQIQAAMRAAVARRGLTHAQLAERLGVKQPSVTQLLGGRYGRVPESLLSALDALGLQLQIVETQADAQAQATQAQARAEAMSLLSSDPYGKKPAGLSQPAEFEGPAFEELLSEHRGPEH